MAPEQSLVENAPIHTQTVCAVSYEHAVVRSAAIMLLSSHSPKINLFSRWPLSVRMQADASAPSHRGHRVQLTFSTHNQLSVCFRLEMNRFIAEAFCSKRKVTKYQVLQVCGSEGLYHFPTMSAVTLTDLHPHPLSCVRSVQSSNVNLHKPPKLAS